jgi:trehalose/maltose hydrolase-like predicted phosphorylase
VAILNGFAGVDPDSRAEAIARAPYPLAGDIELNKLRLSQASECAVLREQSYDFSSGELKTAFTFRVGEVLANVDVLTFCSRTMPTLVLQEVTVSVDRACDFALSSGVEPRGIPGRQVDRSTRTRGSNENPVDGSIQWRSHGDRASCGVAYITDLAGAEAEPTVNESDFAPLETRYAFRARSGRRYRLRQITAVVSEFMHHEPDIQAVRLAHAGHVRGFERLRDENRQSWDDMWTGRIELVGAPSRWQALVDAAFFYLHTSVHPSSPTSSGIFGLAYWPDYHYYRGHVMWDLETFVVPPLILTHPQCACTLLEYRSKHVEAARLNAAMNGYQGVQFPWESGIQYGEESAPGEGAASAHEDHVSLDVAFAFSQLLHATNDWRWGREHAWKVLAGVADWVQSRGSVTKRGFEIHDVNGVAEKQGTVSNNAYVNMAASVALREAVALAPALGQEPDEGWAESARNVYLPMNGRVIKNHDAYRKTEEKGETPEAAAGLFPLSYECRPEVERATFEFYLGLADRYVGAPMLSALLGVYAARIGDRERALELFERGYAAFVVDPFSVTTEYDREVFPEQPVAAPFAANTGGFLTSCLYGLPGLRLGQGEPDTWGARAVTLPSGWDEIHVNRIWARGRPAELIATHGADRATVAYHAD